MTKLVFGHDAIVAAWVAARLPHFSGDDIPRCTAIGIEIDGQPVAGVVYHDYRPEYRSIHLSIAADSPRWATKRNISALLRYPFAQLECQRVTCTVPRRHRRSRKLCEGLGFVLEGKVRKGYGTDDMMVYGLLRHEAARWVEND